MESGSDCGKTHWLRTASDVTLKIAMEIKSNENQIPPNKDIPNRFLKTPCVNIYRTTKHQ